MKRPRDDSGFSALEATIALALLAIGLSSALWLYTQTAREQARLEQINREISNARNALAILETLNPEETPEGNRSLGDGAIMVWASAPVSALAAPSRGSERGHKLRLYRVRVTVETRGKERTFAINRVGWDTKDMRQDEADNLMRQAEANFP